MIARIIEWCCRVQDCLLGKIEDFGNVEGKLGGTLDASFNFLQNHKNKGQIGYHGQALRVKRTLNSFIMGIISSSKASLVTSPPRKSILLPTRITGTYRPIEGKHELGRILKVGRILR